VRTVRQALARHGPAVVDIGSRNGTFRNGNRVPDGGIALALGDLLRCGDTVFAVTTGAQAAAVDITTHS
jgi:SARP family transcriptional regulator, regulator of embCAB operon